MTLAYKTVTVWDHLLSAEEQAQFDSALEPLIAAGKTDGNKIANWPDGLPATVTRLWATEQDGLDWGVFCNTFTPPPVSFQVSLNT
jgi:hypothetical protein